jgi:hypothetical protein
MGRRLAAAKEEPMKRLELTEQKVRCPVNDCTATLTVRSDPDGYPSRRHVAVTACSLLPPTSFVPPAIKGYFADLAPPVRYLYDVDPTPRHCSEIACSTLCLAVLNAAEPGASEAIRCTSGIGDALELARQTQSPAMMRVLWFYSA